MLWQLEAADILGTPVETRRGHRKRECRSTPPGDRRPECAFEEHFCKEIPEKHLCSFLDSAAYYKHGRAHRHVKLGGVSTPKDLLHFYLFARRSKIFPP